MDNIPRLVRRLFKKYKTKCPFQLAKQLNINIQFLDLPEGVNGYYFRTLRRRFIAISNLISEELQIFTCAHEIGHDRLHKGLGYYFIEQNTYEDCLEIKQVNETLHKPFGKGGRQGMGQYLLSGIAYCSICGSRMNGIPANRGSYICSGYQQYGRGHHEPFYIDKNNWERTVWNAVIHHFITNDQVVSEYEKELSSSMKESQDKEKNRIKELEEQEKDLEQQFLEMTKLKVKKLIIESDYKLFYDELNKERNAVEMEKKKLQSLIDNDNKEDLTVSPDIIRKMIREAENIMGAEVPVEQKRALLSMFIEKVEGPILVNGKRHTKIHFNISPPSKQDEFIARITGKNTEIAVASSGQSKSYIHDTGASSPIARMKHMDVRTLSFSVVIPIERQDRHRDDQGRFI